MCKQHCNRVILPKDTVTAQLFWRNATRAQSRAASPRDRRRIELPTRRLYYLHPPTRYLISKQHTPDIPLLVDCRDFVLHPRETPLVLPTPRTCTLLLAPGRSPSTPLIRTRRHALALPLTATRPSAPQRDTSELCSSEDFSNLRHCGHQSAP